MANPSDVPIGFIGAGKVGISLGSYFQNKGFRIAGYHSRSAQSSKEAADITSSLAFESIEELVRSCGILFVTTPDNQISLVWQRLSHCEIAGKLVCHTSGSLSSELFFGIEGKGAFGYSVHPMFSFAHKNGDIEGLEKACFTIEGDERRLKDMQALFAKLGNKTIAIGRQHKALYHLANAMVSNLVLALVHMGCECLERCGADGKEAVSALMPLVSGTIENIKNHGFVDSLTGPVERNDMGTVQKHLAAMPIEYRHIYRDLSRRLVEVAEQKHPDRDYSGLMQLLDKM